MADFHSAHLPEQEEADASTPRRARIGQILFIVYLTIYTGFVLLNAFAVSTIEHTQLFGINLAVNYGLALIAVAFLFAVIYDVICRRLSRRPPQSGEGRG